MFTQEHLSAIKGVFVEAIKPLEVKILAVEETINKNSNKNDEQFDAVHVEVQSKSKALEDQITVANIRLCEVLDKLDSQEDQIGDISEQVTVVDAKINKTQLDTDTIKGDVTILLDTTGNMEEKLDELGGITLSLKDDMRRLKANTSIWVTRDSGDDSYTPAK